MAPDTIRRDGELRYLPGRHGAATALAEELGIEFTAGEFFTQLFQIDADNTRFHAGVDHVPGEGRGFKPPLGLIGWINNILYPVIDECPKNAIDHTVL